MSCAGDGGRGVCSSDVHDLVQKPVSAAEMQLFTHAKRSPRASQIAGRVVCESKVDITAGISARDSVAMEKSFLQLVFEVLCDATATLVQLLDCRPPHSLYTLLASEPQPSVRESCVFVLLPVVYRDGTFKLAQSRCVCVVFSSHSFWTSSSLDVPAGVTQEKGHTGFFIHLLSAVRALIFLARRIQPFLSLVDREVEFCVLRAVLMGTKSCTKILMFPRFSQQDFVSLFMGKNVA